MTWFDRLHANPRYLAEYHQEYVDSYSPRNNIFNSCIDEFEVFQKLGLKRLLGDCSGDCMECEIKFLTDPDIYEFTTKGDW